LGCKLDREDDGEGLDKEEWVYRGEIDAEALLSALDR
jgi:hypothetical protein